ncbi:hypothetical protein QP938_08635 [Porticoccaceae bacterium LTM1]|nr:hypothetical protein QP938_08635 [Porticoccaceae bacterium LTM1]
MSKALKKVLSPLRKVRKVFKKIISPVKKLMKKKWFKLVLMAAAVYFTAGAAMGAFGAGGTAAAGTAGATTTTVGATSAAGAGASGISVGIGGAGTITSTGTLAGVTGGSAGGVTGGLLSKVAAWTTSNQLLASTALTTGGNMLSSYAEAKDQEEKEKKWDEELTKRNSTKLDVYDRTKQSAEESGYYGPSAAGKDSSGRSEYRPLLATVAERTQNIDARPPHFYDSSTNHWKPVEHPLNQRAENTGMIE